jgi:hypothetical protein
VRVASRRVGGSEEGGNQGGPDWQCSGGRGAGGLNSDRRDETRGDSERSRRFADAGSRDADADADGLLRWRA